MEKAGERIKGSKFVRDFCARCGEPIRVITIFDEKVVATLGEREARIQNFCNDCDPRPPVGYSSEPTSEIRYNG